MRRRLLLALLMMAAPPAHAEQTAPASAYRQVMQAQYAAQGGPLPMRPEEAQRIYESYLRSLGQSRERSPDSSTDSGGNAGIPTH